MLIHIISYLFNFDFVIINDTYVPVLFLKFILDKFH